jgi:hypothetical protein
MPCYHLQQEHKLLLLLIIIIIRHHARTQQIRTAVVQVSAAHMEFERGFIYFKRYTTNYYIKIIDVTDTAKVKR